MTDADLDRGVRLHIYDRFLEAGSPPTVSETAQALGRDLEEIGGAYRRLEENRVIVLAPGTLNVWMANPLSAVPTQFRVDVDGRTYFGNCIWDALGIPAMLGADGDVSTWCPDCQEPIVLRIERGSLAPEPAIVHFAVPAALWWDNIGFT